MAGSEQKHRGRRGRDRGCDCEDSANPDREYRQSSRFILYVTSCFSPILRCILRYINQHSLTIIVLSFHSV